MDTVLIVAQFEVCLLKVLYVPISDRIRVIYFYGIPVIIRFLNFFLSKLIRICTVIHLVADDIAAYFVKNFIWYVINIIVEKDILIRIKKAKAV